MCVSLLLLFFFSFVFVFWFVIIALLTDNLETSFVSGRFFLSWLFRHVRLCLLLNAE